MTATASASKPKVSKSAKRRLRQASAKGAVKPDQKAAPPAKTTKAKGRSLAVGSSASKNPSTKKTKESAGAKKTKTKKVVKVNNEVYDDVDDDD